ncbi:MAG: HNH endonuclease [Desulfobacterales bacterium]|nr:HNH endonuclease [Desulfobacterales bacterium]
MSETTFCIYEGRHIPNTEVSDEHIIPLSLGGTNSLVIPASKAINSVAGEIEGKLGNELGMSLRRNEFDVRGHSRKRPVPTYKSGKIEELDLPVQVQLDKRNKEMRLFSPRHRRYLENSESAGLTVKFNTNIDLTTKIRFTAKVAIGAGYFIYGSVFAQFSQVEHLRALMKLDEVNMSNDLKVIDPMTSDLTHQQKQIREMGKAFGLSTVIVVPSENDISFSVTCLGEFCGILRVPADTTKLPNSGKYTWGHILASNGKKLTRGSFERGISMMRELAAKLED